MPDGGLDLDLRLCLDLRLTLRLELDLEFRLDLGWGLDLKLLRDPGRLWGLHCKLGLRLDV